MRTLAMVIAAIVISTTNAAWAQDWVQPPTRVCEIGLYACSDHPQIQATWPTRCPICGTVLAAAPGGGAAGAAGGMGATGRPSTGARAQSPGAAGRGGTQFRRTPEQQFRRQFPQTPEQRFRQQFPETPEQQFRRQFPETPEQQFGRRFPNEELRRRGFQDREFGERGFPQ